MAQLKIGYESSGFVNDSNAEASKDHEVDFKCTRSLIDFFCAKSIIISRLSS